MKDYEEGIDHCKWLIQNKVSISILIESMEVNAIDDTCSREYCDGFKNELMKHITKKEKK